jgi:tRNA-specific 2-thiouridylase
MSDFLEAFVPDDPGPIVTLDGERVGTHRGLHYYTIGQRKGIGVASPEYRRAYVVVEKRVESKELVIGWDEPETEGLYAGSARLASVSWTRHAITEPAELLARPRYRAPSVPAGYIPVSDNQGRIEFRDPQRALAVGQICALYDGRELLGGGVFESIGVG